MALQDYIKFNEGGTTRLHDLAMQGSLASVIEDLRLSGERLSLEHFLLQDNEGYTPLHWAVAEGELPRVLQEIESSGEKLCPDHFTIESRWGWTPLHKAAQLGKLDQVMEALAVSGQKFSAEHFLASAETAGTPLYFASMDGHLDQVFLPSYWKGRVGEMLKLWHHLPSENQGDFDFRKRIEEAMLLSRPVLPKVKTEAFSEATRSERLLETVYDLRMAPRWR